MQKKCIGCGKDFKYLTQHTSRNKFCSAFYSSNDYCKYLSEKTNKSTKSRAKKFYKKHKDKVKEKLSIYYVKEKANIAVKRKQNQLNIRKTKIQKVKHVTDPIFSDFLNELDHETSTNKMQLCKRQNLTILQAIACFNLENLFGARFTCISCHKIKFGNGVRKFVPEQFGKLNLENFILVNYLSDATFRTCDSLWVCHACYNYLMDGKMSPISAANQLDISIWPGNLNLSEIENALLAPVICFMKILKLPNSRMPALRDRVVNVPILLNKINESIESLPRTIEEAKIIPVAIKRKRSYIHNYIQQFINPAKMLKAINLLKNSYPPFKDLKINYKKLAYLTGKSFKDTCEEGIGSIESEELNVEDEIAQLHDNIAKFQPTIDSHIVLLPENLEEHVNIQTTSKFCSTAVSSARQSNANNIVFAPGEGETPVNILKIRNPLVLQFPALFPTGEFGLHDEKRKLKISIFQFVGQRILNVNRKFSETKSFLFSALYMLEMSQLYGKINLSYKHGTFKHTPEGKKFLKVQDSFQIFNDIPGSMRYLQAFKYDNIARIEQNGKPTLFYTNSCPNYRWPEILATVIPKKFPTQTVMHELEEQKINLNEFLDDISDINETENRFYNDEDELLVHLSDNVKTTNSPIDMCEEEKYFVHHLEFNCFSTECKECHIHLNCHRICMKLFLDNLPNELIYPLLL